MNRVMKALQAEELLPVPEVKQPTSAELKSAAQQAAVWNAVAGLFVPGQG